MITQVLLHNWQCFRGKHTINLKAKAYAIVASYEYDAGRSNYGGKSAILEAIVFAITGQFNKLRKFDADGWITKGEAQGSVRVSFEDGITIYRERKRGSATQVRLVRSDGKMASQEDASIGILKHLAFQAEDLPNIAYFEQRQMAKIIHTDPEKRFDIVKGWLGLAPAEKAEKHAHELVLARMRMLQQAKARRENLQSIIDTLMELPDEKNIAEIRDQIQKNMEGLNEERLQNRELERHQNTVSEYRSLVEDGRTIAEEVKAIPEGLQDLARKGEEDVVVKATAHAQALTNLASKRKVALGQFDGQCPVADIECPAKKRINDDRKTSHLALKEAKDVEENTAEALHQARTHTMALVTEAREAEKKDDQLIVLRERVQAMGEEFRDAKKRLKEAKESRTDDEIREELLKYRVMRDNAVSSLAEIKAKVAQREGLQRDLKSLDDLIALDTKQLSDLVQTRTIFRATQRRVAERALDRIGHQANAMLHEAGSDLTIDIQWEREGKNLAKTCEICGTSFPASAKVKECVCGAERGQHVIQRLDFVRNQSSGAADDFAGIAMQLAAGSWLLGARESPWATAMVDEPFSQMDRSLRKAAAKQMLNLLGSSAFRQVLVISHSQETVEVYPGRIRILVLRDGTRQIETY